MEINDYNNPLNTLDKQIESKLAFHMSAIPVKVVSVNSEARTVDVLPMVHMVDSYGNAHPHTIVHGLPFARQQGGNYGVICDPVVGDKGQIVVNSRNIEKVITTRDAAPPDNARINNLSDGVYIGNLFNDDPDIYIRFKEDGIEIKGDVTINGNLKVNGDVSISGDAVIGGISFKNHTHSNGNHGDDTGVPNG